LALDAHARGGAHAKHGLLAKAGFDAIEIVPTRVYSLEDARGFLSGAGLDVDAVAPRIQDRFMSAFIRARKGMGGE